MKSNFPKALSFTLGHEGLWSDDPDDPGGATMHGITLKTYREVAGSHQTKESLLHIMPNEVSSIYHTRYWNAVRGDDLPNGLDICVFDFGVNSGPGTAIKALQKLAGAKVDGSIGPLTLAAVIAWVGKVNIKQAIGIYQQLRMTRLQGLPTFAKYGKGWTTRVNDLTFVANVLSDS